jgi:hypothetical protein
MGKLRKEVFGKTEVGKGRETEGMGEQKISRSGDQGFGSGSSIFSNCGSSKCLGNFLRNFFSLILILLS